MSQVIIAPEYVEVTGPLIFLAGPIQGAPDWQDQAIRLLIGRPGITVASPRRAEEGGEFGEEKYNEQVDWEHHYLAQAATDGVIMFWLAREAERVADRAYAQTTRFELGEAMTLHHLQGTKVVVGAEEGFSGSRYLWRTIAKKAEGIPLCHSLTETCDVAYRLATGG